MTILESKISRKAIKSRNIGFLSYYLVICGKVAMGYHVPSYVKNSMNVAIAPYIYKFFDKMSL